MPDSLKDKAVLITGGAKHLGKTIALAMAQEGAQVAFTYLSSPDEANQTFAQIKKASETAMALKCDVRSSASIAEAVKAVVAKFGRLDVLVNNAGFYEDARFPDITEEQWDNMFAINVRGPFLAAKLCTPALRAARGRIINIGSLGGQKAWATHAHYCASKAALHMLTQVMAKALAPEIAVNCIAPGMISYGETNSDETKRFAAKTPMGRNGTADDVASAVLYLATAPHFTTGQIITVDGGLGLV